MRERPVITLGGNRDDYRRHKTRGSIAGVQVSYEPRYKPFAKGRTAGFIATSSELVMNEDKCVQGT